MCYIYYTYLLNYIPTKYFNRCVILCKNLFCMEFTFSCNTIPTHRTNTPLRVAPCIGLRAHENSA